jgi:hypothetical protein
MALGRKKNSKGWLQLVGDDGFPEFVPVTVGHKELTLKDGTVLPSGFYKPMGRHGYFCATHCTMPIDGNVAHDGNLADEHLVKRDQPYWLAEWATYDQMRRGLNLSAVLMPGTGLSAAAGALGKLLIILLLFFSLWGSWGVRGSVNRLADSVPAMQARIEQLAAGTGQPADPTGALGKPAVRDPNDPGVPTGDR